MTRPRQCSNCSVPKWQGDWRLCKACLAKAGLTSTEFKEKRTLVTFLLAVELDPSSLLDKALGFENSTQNDAMKRLIVNRRGV